MKEEKGKKVGGEDWVKEVGKKQTEKVGDRRLDTKMEPVREKKKSNCETIKNVLLYVTETIIHSKSTSITTTTVKPTITTTATTYSTHQ